MKKILLFALLSLCAGCEERITWQSARKPITAEDRRAVADQEARLLSHIPTTLSGHDQDWDDAVTAAHTAAMESCSPVTMWEYSDMRGYTGRWRYSTEVPAVEPR